MNIKFKTDTALLLAKLCVECYQKVEDFNTEQFGLQMVKKINNEKTDVQGFIAKKNKTMFIVFRGANTIKDYMRDMTILYKNYPPSKRFFFKPKVHMGFFNGYMSVKDEIKESLISDPDINTLYVTGHSMGAALAVYCAYDFYRDFKYEEMKINLYTFGCPEVGNGSFVKKFQKAIESSYRVVNDEDLIAKINIPGLGHIPTLILLKDNEIIINPSKVERLKEAIDDILTAVTGEAIKDHLSANYVKTLEKHQTVL